MAEFAARAEPELPSVGLALRVDDGVIWAFLADGRALARQGRAPWPPRLPGAWPLLLPGPVGAWLASAPAGLLHLQITPDLDPLPWEQLDNADPVARKFLITRVLADDESGAHPPGPSADPAAPRAPGRLRRVILSDRPAGAWRRGEDGPPTLLPITGLERGSAQAQGLLCQADLLVLAHDRAELLTEAIDWARWTHRPRAVVVGSAGGDAPTGLAQRVLAAGGSLLVLPTDPASAAWQPWVACLEALLAAGATLAAALHTLRAQPPRLAPARLYGPLDLALDDPPDLLARERERERERERRQVTTVAFDLVDSTPLLRRLGDEGYARLLAEIHRRRVAIVDRHGGRSDEAMGDDGVLSFFGHPNARETSARDAVAAALEIRDAVVELGVSSRIGVATGTVAINDGQPHGVSLVLASRLESATPHDTVLVAESTHTLTRDHFSYAPPRTLELKGLGTVQAWQARSAATPAREGAAAQRTPFVGRSAELSRLFQVWDTCQSAGPRVVALSGEAGIGKSRLVREFRELLRERHINTLEARGQPETASTPFGTLSQALRRLLQVRDTEPTDAALERIARALPAPMDRSTVVPLIAGILGFDLPQPALSSTDEGLRWRRQMLEVLIEGLRLMLLRQPMCLVVEDFHWTDPSSREFIVEMVPRVGAAPLLLLLTLREGAAGAALPPLVHETLRLEGLPPEESRLLVRRACGATWLPEDVTRRLAARADGVPLFLEELVRAVVDERRRGATEPDPLLREVPFTLHDVLRARLDRLGAARRTAQLAAVIGRVFDVPMLQALAATPPFGLSAAEAAHQLQQLVEGGIVLPLPEAGDFHGFRHALLRDAAYESLWFDDRRAAHAAIASMVDQGARHGAAPAPEVRAYHLEQAGRDDAALQWWEAAARQASDRGAFVESLAHLQKALALVARQNASRARDEHELRLTLLLASRCIATQGYGSDEVERTYLRARQLARSLEVPAALLRVELGLEAFHFTRANFDQAEQFAQRAMSLSRQLGGEMALLQCRWALANIRYHQGQAQAALRQMDECVAAYRPELHRRGTVQDPAVMCLAYSSWCSWDLGHADDAVLRAHRALELGERLEHRLSKAVAHGLLAGVLQFRGETTLASTHADQCVAICEDAGFSGWQGYALVARGSVRCELGRVREGLADIQQGQELWRHTGAVVTQAYCLRALAQGLALGGRPAEGLPLLHEALEIIRRTGERYHEAEVLRLLGELTLITGAGSAQSAADGERLLREAHAAAMGQGLAGHALRSAVTLADHWAGRGRHAEARTLLSALLATVTEGHDTRDPRAARALLEQLPRGAP